MEFRSIILNLNKNKRRIEQCSKNRKSRRKPHYPFKVKTTLVGQNKDVIFGRQYNNCSDNNLIQLNKHHSKIIDIHFCIVARTIMCLGDFFFLRMLFWSLNRRSEWADFKRISRFDNKHVGLDSGFKVWFINRKRF